MKDDSSRDRGEELQELLRAVRDLSFRVSRLEKRLEEFGGWSGNEYPPDITHDELVPVPAHSRLESRIGSQWLNRIGVIAVLFGVAYLLRYAFVSDWISAATWIWLGVCAGALIVIASEWFRRRGYRVLSLSLKAAGIGVSYLSLWAGLELYKLLSGPESFSGLFVLTALGAVLALRESAEVLAALALVAGFLTPLLISIPSSEPGLFFYIAILDCAAAVLALQRDWWKLLAVSFLGTVLISEMWYFRHYTPNELSAVVLAATFFFVAFCTTSVWLRLHQGAAPASRALTILEVANASIYFASLYLLLNLVSHNTLILFSTALAIVYFALAWKTHRTLNSGRSNQGSVLYGWLGIAFLAATLALLLESDWLSLGWFIEAAAIMLIGFWRDIPWLRWGALVLLCAAIVKAFAYDVWKLGLGARTLSFIALGVLLLIMSFAYQRYGFAVIVKTGKEPNGLH